MHSPKFTISAILLLGPTGSGKTPVGQLLQARGLWSRGCRHLDFGARLREIAARPASMEFDARTVDYIRTLLSTGALLENESFPVAAAIIRQFVRSNHMTGSDILLLNGIPRHVGQARSLAPIVRVAAVINLTCEVSAVYDRIRHNIGGDRSERQDDRPEDIERKLRIYEKETAPVVDFYRTLGVPVICLEVGEQTTAEQTAHLIAAVDPPALCEPTGAETADG